MNTLNRFHELQSPPVVNPGFRIEAYDRLTIEGKSYRLIGNSGPNVVLRPADDDGLAQQFSMANLSRLSAAGKIKHEVGYYVPDGQKNAVIEGKVELLLSELPPNDLARLKTRHAIVQAALEVIEEKGIGNNENDFAPYLEEIRKRARGYRDDHALEREMRQHSAARNGQTARRSRGNTVSEAVDLPHPSTIRKMVTAYQKNGIAGLADRLARSGNRNSYFRPEEISLLARTIRESYLTLERKSLRATTVDVRRAFKKENEKRAADGKDLLRIPGRDAVRERIKKIDRLTVLIARHGRQAAIKKLRPVTTGLQIARPLQRVEMDECQINLLGFFASESMSDDMQAQLLKEFGLDGGKGRWWLVAAIDCRTRIILGMKLTRDPKASSARECLRMVLSDKGEWRDAVGAVSPWPAGVPESLVTDNGAAFKAWLFNSTCLNLGISLTRTIAGMPTMRGFIERVFGTVNGQLGERIEGRTFGDVKERGDYPSEDRACLDTDDQAYALVRYIVDIYHNSPHEGLDGRTPLEQWEADMNDGNYPARALPDSRTMRLSFGTELARNLRKTGITIMGVNYHSEFLARHYALTGARRLDVRWDQTDLGAIEVCVDGQWHEVPSVHDRFEGVDVHTWQRTRRSLRARSANRRVWDEETVFKALDDIEALVAKKSIARKMVDTTLSEKQLRNIESSMFSTFEIGGRPKTEPAQGGFGRVITPRQPTPGLPAPNLPKPAQERTSTPPKPKMASPKAAPQKPSGEVLAPSNTAKLREVRKAPAKFNPSFLTNKDKN